MASVGQLGPHHFAFMRALVQGVERRGAFERYLAGTTDSTDERVVRTTTAWIRDRLAAVATREARPGMARLVRIDVRNLAQDEGRPADGVPSLDQFAAAARLDDFTHTEQLEAYEAQFGKALERQRRRERLIVRQLEALHWLEQIAAHPPAAGDNVAAWLHPATAERLHRAETYTLHQLTQRINGLGKRWHSGIRGLGPVKAGRLVGWLAETAHFTGLELGSHTVVPRGKVYSYQLAKVVRPATDVRPLEKLVVPVELDGSHGAYRRPQSQCLLGAGNDYEAVLAWLRSKRGLSVSQRDAKARGRRRRAADASAPISAGSGLQWLADLSNTQRAYRKEAERLLLWAVVERQKPLSSLTHEDCSAYRDFIADPSPTTRWCAPRSRQRWSPLWRPFEGPLSPAAQRQAIVVLQNLWSFLVDQNYLSGNPWTGVTAARARSLKAMARRSLTVAQMKFAEWLLAELDPCPMTQRLGFAIRLLYATGLRISEAVAARTDDLQRVSYPAERDGSQPVEGWMLRVVGKSDKVREVPVPEEVVTELGQYLAGRGLSADPACDANRGAHLLGKATGGKQIASSPARSDPGDARDGISSSALHDQMKAFFGRCGARLRVDGDARGAERFERATTHWLRHTHASHVVASGMPVEIVQQNLGHASLATVTVYVTSEDRARMAALQGFWGSRLGS